MESTTNSHGQKKRCIASIVVFKPREHSYFCYWYYYCQPRYDLSCISPPHTPAMRCPPSTFNLVRTYVNEYRWIDATCGTMRRVLHLASQLHLTIATAAKQGGVEVRGYDETITVSLSQGSCPTSTGSGCVLKTYAHHANTHTQAVIKQDASKAIETPYYVETLWRLILSGKYFLRIPGENHAFNPEFPSQGGRGKRQVLRSHIWKVVFQASRFFDIALPQLDTALFLPPSFCFHPLINSIR